MEPSMLPAIVTLNEAATYLRKSPAQMRWMRHTGAGPKSALLGGRVVYRAQDLVDWVEAAFETDVA